MLEVLATLAGVLTALVPYVLAVRADRRRTDAAIAAERSALATERARVTEMLRLLQARSAPAEYAAYVQPYDDPEPQNWVFTEDGLIGVPVEAE